VLNSNCSLVGGCGPGSPQLTWLQGELALHPRRCVAAIFHTPRWSSGTNGSYADMQPFWEVLTAAGATLAISGHDHDYERFQPLNAAGQPDPGHGLTQFVVGTGGAGGGQFVHNAAYSAARKHDAIGVVKFTLKASSYRWKFVSIPSRPFRDSGSASCA
jgi:acid phosphatase type 7